MQFDLKRDLFENSTKSYQPNIWANFARKLVAKPFKIAQSGHTETMCVSERQRVWCLRGREREHDDLPNMSHCKEPMLSSRKKTKNERTNDAAALKWTSRQWTCCLENWLSRLVKKTRRRRRSGSHEGRDTTYFRVKVRLCKRRRKQNRVDRIKTEEIDETRTN